MAYAQRGMVVGDGVSEKRSHAADGWEDECVTCDPNVTELLVQNVHHAEGGIRSGSCATEQEYFEISDVQFSVGLEGETPKVFCAHKQVLAFASDTFKTMFFGSLPERDTVVIEDATPAEFEAFLRFIYTGTTTIADTEVFPLLNLGKKYFVGSLVRALMGHLEESVNAENVGQVINQGQDFLDDLPPKHVFEDFFRDAFNFRVWEVVEIYGEALLNSEEFLNLRKDTVIALLQRRLEVEENILYDKAVAWATAKCASNELPADAESIRKELEGIIQLIRFPAMCADDFARGPAAEAVLTAEEKLEVYKWFTTGIPQKFFPDAPRFIATHYVCDRFENKYPGSLENDEAHAVDVQVDRSIRVTGLGIFGAYGQPPHVFDYDQQNYAITAKLSLDGVVLATKELSGFPRWSKEGVVSVKFDKPIKLDPSKHYTASVTVSGLRTFCGDRGRSTKTVPTKKGNVVFSFKESSLTPTEDSENTGQIPQILFSI